MKRTPAYTDPRLYPATKSDFYHSLEYAFLPPVPGPEATIKEIDAYSALFAAARARFADRMAFEWPTQAERDDPGLYRARIARD